MRILGIDPGSRRCGYGVVEVVAGRPVYVECGVIEPPPQAALAARLAELAAELRDVIRDLRPGLVAVEEVFFAKNARSALALGQARGVALAAAGEAGLDVVSIAPARIKQTVAGAGRAEKRQVGAMVRLLLGLKRPPPTDAADALAVALTCARRPSLATRG